MKGYVWPIRVLPNNMREHLSGSSGQVPSAPYSEGKFLIRKSSPLRGSAGASATGRIGTRTLFSCLLISMLLAVPIGAHGKSAFKATILHMNDTHGYSAPYKEPGSGESIGGFARAATLIRKIARENRSQGRETLVLHGGDMLTGTPLSAVFKGELDVKLFNEMGFTAMVVGNHEFDQGSRHLLKTLRPLMSFSLLSGNTTDLAGHPVFQKTLVTEHSGSGTRIVIMGLTTDTTPVTTHPKNVQGLRFPDPVKTAGDLLKDFSDQDLVIALTHLGVIRDVELAGANPKIDVIVGGHSHTALKEPLKERDSVIVQAGAYARYLGRLDLEVVDGRVVKYRGELIPLSSEIKEDPQIASTIEAYKSRMDAKLSEVIGRTEVALEGSRSQVRSGRNTNLGRLVAFLVAQSQKAQVGLINGGSIRSGIDPGDIKLSDVYTMVPFPSLAVRMELKGEELVAVLQRSVDLEQGSGGKLQTYGVSFRVDDGKVVIEKVGDSAFEMDKIYSVATNDFLAAGGDGYDILKAKAPDSKPDAALISDLVIDFVKQHQVIKSQVLDIVR